MPRTSRSLIGPAVTSGLLMAAYLLLRPYDDAALATTPLVAARAFASPWWVVAHCCGALAIASYGLLALRLRELASGTAAKIARWAALAGVVLVLPYYGAETFALHVIAGGALADPAVLEVPGFLDLISAVREQPVALTSFGAGLLALAVSGIAAVVTWRGAGLGRPWGMWPLGLGMALLLPQYYLPAAGRMAYGVAYLITALALVASLRGNAGSPGARGIDVPEHHSVR